MWNATYRIYVSDNCMYEKKKINKNKWRLTQYLADSIKPVMKIGCWVGTSHDTK